MKSFKILEFEKLACMNPGVRTYLQFYAQNGVYLNLCLYGFCTGLKST